MKKTLIALSLATLASVAAAQSAAPDAAAHDHKHAAGSTEAPAAAPSGAAPAGRTRSRPAGAMAGHSMMGRGGATQEALAKLDTQIAALRAMHARLQAAPSTEARRAMLAEQMQLVQQSLALADATPMPAMPMMSGGMMNGMGGRGMGPTQRSPGEASGSASQPMPGGTTQEPMHGGMPTGAGMAGMMTMHQLMAKRMELLHATVQALADRTAAAEAPR